MKTHVRRWTVVSILGPALLAGLILWLGRVPAMSSTVEPIKRFDEPIIVTGAEVDALAGTPTDELFVYAYRDSNWQQIPFQVDEVASGVYTATEGSPLDGDDEIVFMESDLGDRASSENIAASLPISQTWYRVEISDPLSPVARGWAYIVRSSRLARSFTETYASYDPVNERITTSRYALGFLSGQQGFDYLALNGSGTDILDRTKIRIQLFGGSVTYSEDDDVLDAAAPAPVKEGPVRVIVPERGVIGYGTAFVIRFGGDLGIKPTAVRLSMDFNADVVPATYYDANTPSGVPIDGKPDDVPDTPLSRWKQVSSDTGTVIQVSDASGSGGIPMNYYKDNSLIDSDDTGDNRSYGDMGTRVEDPNETVLYASVVFVLPGSASNIGEQYEAWAFNPLEVTTVQGTPCPVPLAGVTISGPGDGTTDVTYPFSATVVPSDSTTPITYTWSSSGLVSGQGASEAYYRWTTAGTQVVSVTVQNCGGVFSDSHTVEVSELPGCEHPLTGVLLNGPGTGDTDRTLVFTASPEPSEATLPITFTWSDDGLVDGQGTREAYYRWTVAGHKDVQVTARNCGEQDFTDVLQVEIREHVYLPMVVKQH